MTLTMQSKYHECLSKRSNGVVELHKPYIDQLGLEFVYWIASLMEIFHCSWYLV